MTLRSYKSFLQFRVLRRKYGPIPRGFLALLIWYFGIFSTGRVTLARDLAASIWDGNDIVLPLRRAAWYGRRGWLSLPFGGKDHTFDFTANLSLTTLSALQSFVHRTNRSKRNLRDDADKLFIAARRMALAPTHEEFQDAYRRHADRLLDHVPSERKWLEASLNDKHVTRLRKPDAVSALRDLSRIVPVSETPWFVLSGTFLGIVREGGFLPHDYDIDAGLMADDVNGTMMIEQLVDSGKFALRKLDVQRPYAGDDLTAPRPMLAKLKHRNGAPIDLFFHYRTTNGEVVHGSSLHHWFNSPFDLQSYDLEGVSVLGPSDADRYLTENYGEWRVPVTEFNCTTDTSNMRIVRHPVTIAVFLRRMMTAFEAGRSDGPNLARELLSEGILERSGNQLKLAATSLPQLS